MTDSILKDAAKKLSTPAGAFMKSFFQNVPEEDLKILSAEQIARIAQTQWDLATTRRKGEPGIRVYSIAPEKNESGAGFTVIDIVNDDMAFLVDSVAAEISRHGKLISLLLHPVLEADLSSTGKIKSIHARNGKGDIVLSHMHIRLQGAMVDDMIATLKADLLRILRDVRHATRDWQDMRARLLEAQLCLSAAPGKSAANTEFAHFIDYLYRDNFTLLGYREYKFRKSGKNIISETVKDSGLGLLRDDMFPVYITENTDGLPQDLQRVRYTQPPLAISKVNRRSTVHRRVPLDAVAVKIYDKKGHVTGEHLFIGLFTSVTYSRSIHDIPILRGKAEAATTMAAFRAGSHNSKALRHILEKYPRDDLFQIDADELLDTATSILRLQERHRIALYTRRDPFRRYISCLVYVPRDRYDTRLRLAMQSILEREMSGICEDFYTNLDDSVLARVAYTIRINQNEPPKFNTRRIEAQLQDAGRVWSEKLSDALLEVSVDETDIPAIVHRFGQAFPISYTEQYTPKQAVYDLYKTEEALSAQRMALDLYRDKQCGENQLRLKIYNRTQPVTLSAILPVLENMGLKVISELPFEIRPRGSEDSVWIQDFMMDSNVILTEKTIDTIKETFEQSLLKTWYGETENDSLNSLVLSTGMNWRDVLVLRAYAHYMHQAKSSFSLPFIERALTRNAAITGQAVDLFAALFTPGSTSAPRAARINQSILQSLESVSSLDEDRVLRMLAACINATLRTNFFQPEKDGKPKTRISFKLDSGSLADLPDPKPFREIFVYSPRVEGIHLRSDVISRGGIRWSDRFEDFRTEVLSLMKAQQVKNSIIVPMGAKGGFVVKQPPATGGREAYLKEGIECYKLFIRSLLEITDNRKGDKIIAPPHVVRRDKDDPYLVVAADKGTASFSDIANGLSAEFNFWLGDAFASGGSAGYDHKKMGITARGAWESVKRHFRELNHDTQSQNFDVIGVGDMAGDVFGNGMLLSPHIRLIGAFNHAHIFCDPMADEKSSFAERERLFKAVKAWDGYDLKKLGSGGRIYSRADKSLKLTPEIKNRFGIDKDNVTPAELIQAMLRAKTDLLWFGGIGTYVKADSESHADAGDKGNDSLRVNASEINAKVIGEGANLAVTQNARGQLSGQGVKLNADFIDNSGGVNSSDVEVNIKILINEIMANPKTRMPVTTRNKFLAGMTDEVSRLVLQNNYQQTQGISLMEMQAADMLPVHERLIEELERNHGLKRKQEGLPARDVLEERRAAGKGLTRPEICILQAHAKIVAAREILDSTVPDMKDVEETWLHRYFPTQMQRKYATEITRHRLRREIIATGLASAMVNRMGLGFVYNMKEKTGATAADIVRAHLIVREAFSLRDLWGRIEALDAKVPALVQLRAMQAISRTARRETLWFLTRPGRRAAMDDDIRSFRAGVDTLRARIGDVVTDTLRQDIAAKMEKGLADGLPQKLAHEIAILQPLGAACDIIRASEELKADIPLTAAIYYALGEHYQLHWLRERARTLDGGPGLSGQAVEGMLEQLYACQSYMTMRILRDLPLAKRKARKGTIDGMNIVRTWAAAHAEHLAPLDHFLADLRRASHIDMATLVIADQKLRILSTK